MYELQEVCVILISLCVSVDEMLHWVRQREKKNDSAHKESEVSWVDLSKGEACLEISVNW